MKTDRIKVAFEHLLSYETRLKRDIEIMMEEVPDTTGLNRARRFAILEIYKDLLIDIEKAEDKVLEIERLYKEKFARWR